MNTYTVISITADGWYEVVTSITQAKDADEAKRNCIVPEWHVLGVLEGQQVLELADSPTAKEE